LEEVANGSYCEPLCLLCLPLNPSPAQRARCRRGGACAKGAAVTWTSRNAPLALNALDDLPLSMRTTPPQRCPPRPPKART